jgi:hypothetical protein
MNEFSFSNSRISIKIANIPLNKIHNVVGFLKQFEDAEHCKRVENEQQSVPTSAPVEENQSVQNEEEKKEVKPNLPTIINDHQAVPPDVLPFDELVRWMCNIFNKNKVETNINNAKTVKSFFVNFLKLHSFELRIIQKTKMILDLLKDRPHVTEKSILCALSKCFQMYNLECPIEYMERVKNLNDMIDQEMKQRILNEKEVENMITQEEIDNLFEKYRNATTFEDRQNYLLLLLYCKSPPLRLDWAECLVGEKMLSSTENCYSTNESNLYLRKYKTSEKYGNKVLKLSKEVNDYIIDFLKFRKEQGIISEYLLLNPTTLTMMSRVNLSKNLSKIFGKSVGCNILRKFAVSSNIDAEKVEAEEKLASAMCHSIAVQKTSYCKKLPKA